MDSLAGIGMLNRCGRQRPVCLQLDLLRNTVRATYPTHGTADALWLVGNCNGDEADPYLTDVVIHTPIGDMRRSDWRDLFVVGHHANGGEASDSLRLLQRASNQEGLAAVELHPKASLVSFELARFPGLGTRHELYYRVYRSAIKEPVSLPLDAESQATAIVRGCDEGVLVESDESLEEAGRVLPLVLGVFHGGPVTLRTAVEETVCKINLCSHNCGAYAALTADPAIAADSLKGLFRFFVSLPNEECRRWSTAIHYYLEGLTSASVLEIRLAHLFSFVEVMDNCKTLAKNTVAAVLNVTCDEAMLLCKMRDAIIHQGASLGDAFGCSRDHLRTRKRTHVRSELMGVPDLVAGGQMVYFWLADLIKEYIRRAVGCTHAWNSYERRIAQ